MILKYLTEGSLAEKDFLKLAKGYFARSYLVVRYRNIQYVRFSETLWQRRSAFRKERFTCSPRPLIHHIRSRISKETAKRSLKKGCSGEDIPFIIVVLVVYYGSDQKTRRVRHEYL